jgi:transcriptional regulator GlxA family with amidase domain
MTMEALTTRRVAVVLFEGFTVLDVYGPVQAFAMAMQPREGMAPHRFFEVVTVAQQAGPVKSGEGPSTVADYSFATLPPVDILLIPGGIGTRKSVDDAALIESIKTASHASAMTTTVCTGTALLARTGLLNGRSATTNKMAWEWVKSQGPDVLWKRVARWVDDGDIVTSSGVSAGTDMALAVVARLHGRETAERAARVMEYVWNDDPDNDPFA